MTFDDAQIGASRLDSFTTLVLNADYRPFQVIHWQPAIRGILDGTLIGVHHHNERIRSSKTSWDIPSVAVMRDYQTMQKQVGFSRSNLIAAHWLIDTGKPHHHWICCLCGKPMKHSELTLEHIVPRHLGGENTWENVLLAHSKCNNLKGSKPLGKSGFTLHVTPYRPSATEIAIQKVRMHHPHNQPVEWKNYIPDPPRQRSKKQIPA